MAKTIYENGEWVPAHTHHIVPKHAGGTDDPENLIDLSIPGHADAHEKLFEDYGIEFDRSASLMLRGLIKWANSIIPESPEQKKRKRVDKVNLWRQRTKDRIVESMGGKCVCCGYKKSNGALAFHHLDPAEKDGSISRMMRDASNWKTIVKELRKCVMLCANCHTEVHDGSRMIAETAARFDESYLDYKNMPGR